MSEMERDLISRHRGGSSSFSGCYTMSPSCFTVHEDMEYSRIHYCSEKRRKRWRNLLRRISTRVVTVKNLDTAGDCFQDVRWELGIYTRDDDGVEYGRAIGGASFSGSMPNHKEQTLPVFIGLH
ncbi:hypothetical protein GOBAR_DD08128 [Gossypium barbadense]|nr:hypothetical protein GOBAR_DD08128 [Gossypium barbadense]